MLDTNLTMSLDAANACTASITIYAGKSRFPQLRGILRDIRPIWLMEELGEPYQISWIEFAKDDHKSAAYRLVNPFARVPALWVGDMTLFESAAVCVFLADRFGRFAPKPGTRERALMDQWLYCAMSTFEPHAGTIFACDFMREKTEASAVARQRAVEELHCCSRRSMRSWTAATRSSTAASASPTSSWRACCASRITARRWRSTRMSRATWSDISRGRPS